MTDIIINTKTGEKGDYADWVRAFDEIWAGGAQNLDRFMTLLSRDVLLIAPGLQPTKGEDAGHKMLKQSFEIFPDLTGSVKRWGANGNTLFIEMDFAATIGGKRMVWGNVDRIVFSQGYAVERRAYFDPTTVRSALLKSPSGLIK